MECFNTEDVDVLNWMPQRPFFAVKISRKTIGIRCRAKIDKTTRLQQLPAEELPSGRSYVQSPRGTSQRQNCLVQIGLRQEVRPICQNQDTHERRIPPPLGQFQDRISGTRMAVDRRTRRCSQHPERSFINEISQKISVDFILAFAICIFLGSSIAGQYSQNSNIPALLIDRRI